MKSKVLTVVLGMVVAGVTHAAGQPVPHSFQAGQKAVAAEVNENFQNLADRIADLSGGTVINLSDFAQADTITGKTFTITNGPCTTDTRTYTHPDAATLVATSTLGGGGSCSGAVTTTTLVTDTSGTRVTEIDTVSPVTNTQTFTPALLLFPAQISKAVPWSGETLFANSAFTPSAGVFVAQYTFIGLEDVTVPAGTFSGCLKIYRASSSSTSPGRIDWRCPGKGLVKQMDPAIGLSELSGITP